jgi:ribosome recycling factor
VRNIRRDAMGDLKKLVKDKEISEDEERRASADIDKLIKDFEGQITKATDDKEADLMAV